MGEIWELPIWGKLVTGLWKDSLLEKEFIEETAKLMNEWLYDSPLKGTAFKAIMIMPSLLLQKPYQISKSRKPLKALERRMDLWTSGEILDLLHEGETIQKDLRP